MFLLICCNATGAHKWRFDVSTSIKYLPLTFVQAKRGEEANQNKNIEKILIQNEWYELIATIYWYPTKAVLVTWPIGFGRFVCVSVCLCACVGHSFTNLCCFAFSIQMFVSFFSFIKMHKNVFWRHQTCMISCNCTNSSATRFLIEFNWKTVQMNWVELKTTDSIRERNWCVCLLRMWGMRVQRIHLNVD